jgi:hypothetical protein
MAKKKTPKELAPKKSRSGPSGPSGLNSKPRMTLHAELEQFARWDAAAARHTPPLTRSEWLRLAADERADRDLKK